MEQVSALLRLVPHSGKTYGGYTDDVCSILREDGWGCTDDVCSILGKDGWAVQMTFVPYSGKTDGLVQMMFVPYSGKTELGCTDDVSRPSGCGIQPLCTAAALRQHYASQAQCWRYAAEGQQV